MRRRGCYFVGVFLCFASGGQLSANSGRKSTPSCQPISSHVAAWKPGHFPETTSLYPPRCIRLWRIQRGAFQRTPAETHGFCTSFAACFTRWRKAGYTFITLRSVFDGICIGNQKAYSSGVPDKTSGFVGERRHSTVIDACRLRRAERYKACVDDMPFDCPLRPRAEGVEIGFYLIITDVPLCCAVCPVPT